MAILSRTIHIPLFLHIRGESLGHICEILAGCGWGGTEEEAILRRCTCTGRPCGSESFTREQENRLGRKLEPAKQGRKRKPATKE
jgi:hypothetical protein